MSSITKLIRKNIQELKPYSTARDEFKGQADIYLDANENPFPSNYNRYPDPLQKQLKVKIASLKNVSHDQIFLGNGSDEAIDLLIRAFCDPGKDSILVTEPTYGMYSVCAAINNVSVVKTTLTKEFELNVDAIKKSIEPSTKLIFLCSPNNPTGNLLSKRKIEELITTFNGIVVVDEAYIDFVNDSGFLSDISRYRNLVVLQTFSKAWGLAGLRMGMAFASAEIINVLNKIKYPYNINTVTQQLALEKINSAEIKNEQVAIVLQQRTLLAKSLQELSIVKKVFPSDANFLLVRIIDAKRVYQHLTDNSIIVRDRSTVVLCDDCLRVTVGTPDENIKLIEQLKNYK